MEKRCDNCFFHRRFNEESVHCRRYPKTATSEEDYFPFMDNTDWCGEWKDQKTTSQQFNDSLRNFRISALQKEFKVETKWFGDGKIVSEIDDEKGNPFTKVIDIQNSQVKDALVNMGWTPPKELK